MDNEPGYFNTDHSSGGRESYENLFAMDPTLFTPSTLISQDPNSHEDLDNILRGGFMDPLGSTSGMMSTGYNTWDGQGTAYSRYPDISFSHGLPVDLPQSGLGSGSGAVSNGFAHNFSEQNGGIQAVTYSNSQSSAQIIEGATSTKASDQNNTTAKLATKRKSDAGIRTTNERAPKPKKKRGPRKTKEKSEEEKRAKEEKKLERNRMAASKCRQKKKAATQGLMENFNELERQNHFMKACLEEVKQDRNNVLALLLEHKGCGDAAVDKCLEIQLERIAGEFEDHQQLEAMLGQQSLQTQMATDTQQFLNSNANSPSDCTQYGQSQIMSRDNSNSIAMSRSGSHVSRRESAASAQVSNHQGNAAEPQTSQASQVWAQHYTPGFRSWQQQFSKPQEMSNQQPMSRQGSTSSSSPGTLMSRQNSSCTSMSQENEDSQKIDSRISNVDTPPEERKKNLMDSPDDEAISLAAQEKGLRSRGPHMIQNQRLAGRFPAGPSDLQDPSVFLSALTIPG